MSGGVPKIGVVDDEDAGRFVKAQILRRAGFTVVEASTGAGAIALVAAERPDVLLLDVNLPDMSGFEVSKRLRLGEKVLPALQILQVSNTAVTPSDRVQGLEQGADAYLVEPIHADVLVATVRALLRVRHAEVALAEALEGERRARQVAEEASRLKDDFIATLSHELRTPLNALMGWIWQLRNTSLSDAARERAFDSLERNARMQAQLINDLLDVSRVSKGKLQLEMRLCDLEAVVTAACEATGDLVAQKHITLTQDLRPVMVAGDQGRLQQIVTNLLTNGVQFTPSGGAIAVSLRAEDGHAVIVVRDSGAGIEPALLPHIFDPFRQGDGVLTRRHGGLGLGLAVVRQLVDLHGGTIDVASEGLGKGASFTLRLPLEPAANAEGRRTHDRLLLDGVRAAIIADAAQLAGVRAALESSGASVAEHASEHDSDVVVRPAADGSVAFRLAGKADAWRALPAPFVGASLVREIAHALMTQPSRSGSGLQDSHA